MLFPLEVPYKRLHVGNSRTGKCCLLWSRRAGVSLPPPSGTSWPDLEKLLQAAGTRRRDQSRIRKAVKALNLGWEDGSVDKVLAMKA